MAVAIAQQFAVGVGGDEFVTAVVFGGLLLGGEEDRVILNLGAVVAWFAGVVVPLLHEKHAGFCAGVGLESVQVQADDGEDAAAFGDVFAHSLVAGVVETALRQHHGHAPAGAQEIEVTLDEEQVAADLAFELAISLVAQLEGAEHIALFDVAGKWRVGHEYVELEIAVVVLLGAQLL